MDGEEVQKLICSDRVGVELCRSQSIFELLVEWVHCVSFPH